MRRKAAISVVLLAALTICCESAAAATFNFTFAGQGVSGAVTLTYGTGTDAKYPQAFQVTGINGTFTDLNNGLNIVNTPILSLVPLNRAAPEPTNLLAPNDFSHFSVATGLPMEGGTFLSYDNLYYPGGSPQTATDYPIHGGFLDIYGLLFTVNGGRTVNLWSNGDFSRTGNGPISYGVAVATPQQALDYVDGVSVTPEPRAFALLGTGLVAIFALRCFRSRNQSRLTN